VKDLTGTAGSGSTQDGSGEATERIALSDRADAETTQVIDSETTQIIDAGATQVIGTTPPGSGPAPTPGRPGGPSRGRLAAIIAGSVLLVLVVVVYLVDLLSTGGKIERHTTVAGVEVGGMTPEQATAALTEQAVPSYIAPVTLDVHGQATPIDPAAAGLTPDVPATIEAVGTRSANPFVRLTSFFTSTEVPLSVQVDDAALTAFLTGVATSTDLQPVEGEVAIDGVTVRTVEPVIGRILDVPGAATAVSDAWTGGGPAALDGLVLPVAASPVRASPEKTQAAAAEATAILAAPLRITGAGAVIEVPVADIAAATTVTPDDADGFVVTVDAVALRGPVTGAVEATQSAPVNAGISIQDGTSVIAPSVAGRTVDWAGTEANIGPALRAPGREAAIVYTETQPEFTTEKMQALGIKEVIGEFTTGGFAAASGENIRVVAEKVNGAIIQPGATFGLNEFTGTRGTEQGYVPAAIIQEGALSTAVGGGISQFATTLYNAAYFAGMGDVTHTPHSFYISRYPPGREATVFDGEIELAFSNDYPTGVYIQTIWTDSDITVRLWGTKHVEVESQTTDRFNFTSPQVIVKPYGTSCSPSSGSTGFSVVNTRIIRDLAGAEIRREDFTTVYNGQQNVVCAPPPAAPAAPAAADPAPAAPAAADPAAPPAAPGG
jgi:vancomycin resistance protein YoaR